MFQSKIKPQDLLSTLWVIIVLNMYLRDLHEFPTEGFIETMMGLHLSEEAMLAFAFAGEIPIIMVLLSRILSNRANKWAQTIAVITTSMGILYTLPGGHLDEIFFAVAAAGIFVIMLITTWRLPSDDQIEVESLQERKVVPEM